MLPGTSVLVLITSIHATGINVQVLGFFDGTIDRLHLPRHISEKTHKVGKKVKARVLYDYSTTPPRFALALNEHIVELGTPRTLSGTSIQEAYPIGRIIDGAKVLRVEPERGVDVEVEDGLEGFAHVSHIPVPRSLYLIPCRFLTFPMSTCPLCPFPALGNPIHCTGLAL